MEEKKEVSNVQETAKKGLEKAKGFATKLKEDKDFLKKVVCYVVVAVVVIVAVVLLLGSMGPKGMAKKYMRAYEKLDHKAVLKMMYKDQADDYEDTLEKSFEYLEDNDFKIKEWEILSTKTLEGNKLEDFQDDFEDEYDVKPSKVVKVKVKVKAKLDDDTDTNKSEIYFAKIKGKWYYVMG